MGELLCKGIVNKHGRIYAVMEDGVGIPFELFGKEGSPAAVLIPGGKLGMDAERDRAKDLARRGYRTLIYDRRNTCTADCGYGDGSKHEIQMQVEDMLALLRYLKLAPAVLIGESSGARLCILFALDHPSAVTSLVLFNLTGGTRAAELLSHWYHHQYVELAEKGGMEAVCDTMWAESMIQHNPDVRMQLLQTPLRVFLKVQQDTGDLLLNTGEYPTLGVSGEMLYKLNCPVKLMWTCLWMGFFDGMHRRDVMETVAECIPQSGELYVAGSMWGDPDHITHKMVKFMNQTCNLVPVTPRTISDNGEQYCC
mmetsp:Transcript_4140/g.7964  ORF Transcript_4140/g.7964 Transcript_4140/m.7964 type:complete len:310 (+) Transcript_4140:248-1177(+)